MRVILEISNFYVKDNALSDFLFKRVGYSKENQQFGIGRVKIQNPLTA